MDVTHKQEYRIRELETRSVTLFPGRAQVHRQIKDVPLKTGENQITIVGLTPTVDQDSIKVEGTGSAIITDMAVELLPNREIFEDVYPEYDDDADDNSDDDPDGASEPEGEDEEERAHAALGDIREKIRLAEDDEKRASELVDSAKRRLALLDGHGQLMTSSRANAPKIDTGLATYRAEREKIFADHCDGRARHRQAQEELQRLRKERDRRARQYRRETARADKLKRREARSRQKEQQKAVRKQQEVRREQARVRREREAFWPKKVYSIRITLDANAFTPGSSRRNSITSDIEAASSSPKAPEKSGSGSDVFPGSTCDLSISYVTTDAHWAPAYDLALSTTANTGHVCFDAQLTNRTSETWANCRITLSTPQADFSGLHDTLPTLVPWRVRLTGRAHGGGGGYYSSNDIMLSRDEQWHRTAWADKQTGRGGAQQPRSELFGMVKAKPPRMGMARFRMAAADAAVEEECEESDKDMGFGHFDNDPMQSHAVQHSLPAAAGPGRIPGAGTPQAPPPPPAALTNANVLPGGGGGGEQQTLTDEPPPPAAELAFQESTFEETGFTTTYDLPGLKTLAPGSTASKQRVARLSFADVAFSHTVVAKYKPVAYLQAKVRNGNKLTLLPGAAGLTLDGSFLGRTDMPRCSPGDSFTLSLGVDPAIKVAYPKPDVRRSQSGVFNKEDSAVYSRTISLSNTRSGTSQQQQQQKQPLPARITVLDQVPVSEDERLRVEVLQPRGLALAGAAGVPAGAPGREGKEEKDWGKAVASLKKGGEVSWDITLHAGRMVKLELEYQCAFPTGDHAVNV
ncbi:hypothetical protein PG994_013582 [Apiospora phragmitis]|uniref:Mucoidy inhibitor-like protein n=1 Tax=Apiospora phragmitis TaxID=2905665 RepID=A0ABR1TBC7_9PEZI